MKRILIWITIIGVGGLLAYNVVQGNRTEVYVNEVTDTVEAVEVEYPTEVTERALKAKEDVLLRYDLEQEKSRLTAESDVLEARIEEIDKELGLHWKERANITELIRNAFPEDPHTALAIAKCESGLNIEAYNPNNLNGTTDGGLWQINDVHNPTLKELGLDKYNPEDATEFARILYDNRGGWEDWVCYTRNMLAMN